MTINFNLDTDNVSNSDKAILLAVASVLSGSSVKAAEVINEAATKKPPTKKATVKETPTDELSNAAEDMEGDNSGVEFTEADRTSIREKGSALVKAGKKDAVLAALAKVGAASISVLPVEKFQEFSTLINNIK